MLAIVLIGIWLSGHWFRVPVWLKTILIGVATFSFVMETVSFFHLKSKINRIPKETNELFKYHYGQGVHLIASAPPPLKTGIEVAIVGMTELDQEREILSVRCPIGSHVYLIEYPDGSSVEVPQIFIEPA